MGQHRFAINANVYQDLDSIVLLLGLYSYIIYSAIVTVFKPQLKSQKALFIAAYMVPILMVGILLSCSLVMDLESYIRYQSNSSKKHISQPIFLRKSESGSAVCWLHHNYVWVYLGFVGVIIAGNMFANIRAIMIASKNNKMK